MIDATLLKGFLVFLCGCMTGSFLNVVIYRIPAEKSIVFPGSKCPKCNNKIAWYDNIPILSWLLLKAKCRYCAEPISMRYPLVELITAIIALLTFNVVGVGLNWILLFYFICTMIVISLVDIDHMLILDCIAYPSVLIGIIYSFINGSIYDSLIASIGGALILYLIAKLSLLIFKKEGMGLGDVSMIAIVGAWFGSKYLLSTFVISLFFGLFTGIILLLRKGKSEYFPFGPSIAVGALITVLTKNYLLNLYLSTLMYSE